MKHVFLVILCVASMAATVSWILFSNETTLKYQPPKMKKQTISPDKFCKGCMEFINNTVALYSKAWRRNEQNYRDFRSLLLSQCNAFDTAIVTQANSPIGTRITKSHVVTKTFFEKLPREHPFSNKTWESCSVVGNGGILYDSYCGRKIDSAQLVFRCNLPPLGAAVYEQHVGRRSTLVTSNPTIFLQLKSPDSLLERFRPFGDAMILIPAFGYLSSLAFKTARTLGVLESPARPVYLNPQYLNKLSSFWRSRVMEAKLSSGLIMISMALEVCERVDVFGFWPLNIHPFGRYYMPHHYYDNTLPKKFHKMPVEFDYLLRLHSDGVIRLHLGVCEQ